MPSRPRLAVGWLCAGALVSAAFTAAVVNSSAAALFGERTTAVAVDCRHYKGTRCDVAIPQRPERTFEVDAAYDAHTNTTIAVRYRGDAVVPDNLGDRLAPLAFGAIGLCVLGAFLITAVARLRARRAPAAMALAIAVPVIFAGLILTSCVAGFTNL